MLSRRELLVIGLAGLATGMGRSVFGASGHPVKLVFVHGREQQAKNPDDLRSNWISVLQQGAQGLGRTLPDSLDISFPYYGDALDKITRQFDIPLTSDIQLKGSPVNEEFLRFQDEIAEALRQRAGITDAQVDQEYGPNPKPKGPLNWEWVQAKLRAIDKSDNGVNQTVLEKFTRDVFLYTTRAVVREKIDGIVAGALTEKPTVVVGHSLGSVVAYSVLRSDSRSLRVPAFITLGSPLAIRAIRDQFRPLKFPKPAEAWYNAYDERDVVALYPLDMENFPVTPAIENNNKVINSTDNHHGISGYLNDPGVAKRILDALGV